MADPIDLLEHLTKAHKTTLLLARELILEIQSSCEDLIHAEQLEQIELTLAKLEWVEVSS